MNAKTQGLIRHAGTLAAGILAKKGYTDDSMTELISALIIAALSIIASWQDKNYREKKDSSGNGKIVKPVAVAGMLFGFCLLTSGCATTTNDVALAQVMSQTAVAYYNQPNNATYMEFEGSNVCFNISGASRMVFSGPIPVKSVYPREEGALGKVIEGVSDLSKVAGLAYVGGKLATAPRTVSPQIVEPKVIEVPAAP